MTKEELLRLSVSNKWELNRTWYIAMFAKPLSDTEYYKITEDKYLLNDGSELEGATVGEPIFKFNDEITITHDDIPTINKGASLKTTLGRYILNLLCGQATEFKVDKYFEEEFTINDYLDEFLSLVVDPKSPFGVKDVKSVGSVASFIRPISHIFVSSAVESMTPPPGLDKVKKEIAAKYTKEDKDWKSNQVKVLEYQDEVMGWVKEQFKDLPQYGITMNKKELASFQKRFILQGIQSRFSTTDELVVIMASLNEGLPLNKKEWTAAMNSMRIGAAGRGLDTMAAGLLAKQIIRGLQGLTITIDDCGTTDAYPMIVSKKNLNILAYLYTNTSKGKFEVRPVDELKQSIGQVANVRIPVYCKSSKGKSICKTCAGRALANNDPTLMGIATGGSALKAALSKFHNSSDTLVDFSTLVDQKFKLANA